MSEQMKNGGPAFPEPFMFDENLGLAGEYVTGPDVGARSGMSLRQYAAIKLRVPDSGSPWLDSMIQQSRRDTLAGQALGGMLAYSHVNPARGNYHENCPDGAAARVAYQYADEMLAARDEGGAA